MGILDFFGPLTSLWRWRNRIGYQAYAWPCKADHVPISYLGEDPSVRVQEPHLDAELVIWNAGHERLTFLPGVVDARGRDQHLIDGDEMMEQGFAGVTLEPGSPPTEVHFRLRPRQGALSIGAGDELRLNIRPTRGRPRKLRIPVYAMRPRE